MGRQNVYVFTWKGKKIALLPSTRYDDQKSKKEEKQKVLLSASSKELERNIKGSKLILVLLAKEHHPPQTTLLEKVQPLISKFADLSPSELPSEFPPMKDVRHQIDFIPWYSLLNLPYYRMNPTKH